RPSLWRFSSANLPPRCGNRTVTAGSVARQGPVSRGCYDRSSGALRLDSASPDIAAALEENASMARRIIIALALIATIATTMAWPRGSAAQVNVADTFPPYQARYFGETGHSAVNWFLETWKNTP